MIRDVIGEDFPLIADFTAGNGALLRTAKKYWPDSTFVATDKDAREINLLRFAEPTWQVGKCDFLRPASRGQCNVLKNLVGQVSLVLLNPPFSCRGASYREIKIGANLIRCGAALAFLLSCLKFLSSTGIIVAVLPTGCLQTEKDETAWNFIRDLYYVEIISRNKSNTFAGCRPRTVVVQLRPKHTGTDLALIPPQLIPRMRELPIHEKIIITRGSVSMHTVTTSLIDDVLPFVHSTELKGTYVDVTKRTITRRRAVQGPIVLMPRVGKPNKDKVSLYTDRNEIVLSDCVIAFKCNSESTANVLIDCLHDYWKYIESAYGGTGAKYISVKKMCLLLSSFGFTVENGSY
ncbi:MAG: hypothetical protein ACRYFS_12770 [Janthinobacterium lividum]